MSLPITKQQALKVAHWIKTNYGDAMQSAVTGTPFSIDIVCGIACQETACFWFNFIDFLSRDDILARCVLDASGDFPDTQRRVFPKNTTAFRNKYGDELTRMLIEEANKTRILRGFTPKNWIYKGYGIFQYDLQNIIEDESFFREKKWYHFSECMDRLMHVLVQKYMIYKDVWKAIKAYNDNGDAATGYANNVIQYASYCNLVRIYEGVTVQSSQWELSHG